MSQSANPEFSHPFDPAEVVAEQRAISAEAGETERQALARRFGIVAVRALAVQTTVKRLAAEHYRLTGHIEAEAVQRCGVTGRPVNQTIAEDLDVELMPEAMAEAALAEGRGADIEILQAGQADLGEIAAQYLALALDPYPRHEEAAETLAALQAVEPEIETTAEHPFAALARLKDGQRN